MSGEIAEDQGSQFSQLKEIEKWASLTKQVGDFVMTLHFDLKIWNFLEYRFTQKSEMLVTKIRNFYS